MMSEEVKYFLKAMALIVIGILLLSAWSAFTGTPPPRAVLPWTIGGR